MAIGVVSRQAVTAGCWVEWPLAWRVRTASPHYRGKGLTAGDDRTASYGNCQTTLPVLLFALRLSAPAIGHRR